jgi:ribosomal protein S18 acetylase RimI-like enzyme
MPETATFVAKVNGKIVGVLSVVGDTPELGLPSDIAFKEEIDGTRKTGRRICEMTNQAVVEEYRKTAVPTELMRCAMAHAFRTGYDKAIAAVSSSHNAFYRLLGFNEIGSERSYSGTIYDPVVALSVDASFYRQEEDRLDGVGKFIQHYMTAGNPFMKLVEDWSGEARRKFMDRALLRQLFVTEGALITNCTIGEFHALEYLWGKRTFSAVTGRSMWAATQNWVQAILSVIHLVDDVYYSIPLSSSAH